MDKYQIERKTGPRKYWIVQKLDQYPYRHNVMGFERLKDAKIVLSALRREPGSTRAAFDFFVRREYRDLQRYNFGGDLVKRSARAAYRTLRYSLGIYCDFDVEKYVSDFRLEIENK